MISNLYRQESSEISYCFCRDGSSESNHNSRKEESYEVIYHSCRGGLSELTEESLEFIYGSLSEFSYIPFKDYIQDPTEESFEFICGSCNVPFNNCIQKYHIGELFGFIYDACSGGIQYYPTEEQYGFIYGLFSGGSSESHQNSHVEESSCVFLLSGLLHNGIV